MQSEKKKNDNENNISKNLKAKLLSNQSLEN